MKRLALLICVGAAMVLVPASAANADFSFQTTALEPGGTGVTDVAVGDVDGVNGPDIVTSYASGGIGVQLNDGHGHFGPSHMYATGCEETDQVELADVGAPPNSIFPDGHLDAVISCSFGGGETIYLGRMFGDGSGGFSAPDMFPESSFGSFNGLSLSHQQFALVEFRGPTGPPVPVWSYLYQEGGFKFHRLFCLSYDWSTKECTTPGAAEEPYIPFVAGRVADSELFTTGGAEGLLGWGPTSGHWNASTRDFGPLPFAVDPADDIWRGITIGDLGSDGPDILTSAGTSGAVPEEPATGRISVLYGNTAEGVPIQHATTFPSALGVEGINTGDFDLDGNTDVVGTYYHYSAGTGSVSGVFFQPGNGAGQLGAPQELPLSTAERFNYNQVQVADLDGNGSPDVVAIVGGKVQVLLNQKVRPPAINPIAPIAPPTGKKLLKALEGIKGLPGSTKAKPNGTLMLGTATNPPTASVGLTLAIPAKGKAKGSSHTLTQRITKKKPRLTVIGAAQITVPAGKTVPLELKLNGKGRAMLKKGTLHAILTLVAVSASGGKETKTEALTIEPGGKKKPAHHAKH